MYVPTTLAQPAAALAPAGIVSSAPSIGTSAGSAISVRSTSLNVLDGHSAIVSGTLRPGLTGRIVMLQTLGSHGWSTVARVRTRVRGRFRVALRPPPDRQRARARALRR